MQNLTLTEASSDRTVKKDACNGRRGLARCQTLAQPAPPSLLYATVKNKRGGLREDSETPREDFANCENIKRKRKKINGTKGGRLAALGTASRAMKVRTAELASAIFRTKRHSAYDG